MKLDRVFYEKTREEFLIAKKKYITKHLPRAILVQVVWLLLAYFIVGGVSSFTEVYLKMNSEYEVLVVLVVLFLPILSFYIFGLLFAIRAEEKILKRIVADNGGRFVSTVDLKDEKSLMLRQGTYRGAKNGVYFDDESGKKIRFFEYYFEMGSGKHRQKKSYRVFGISGFEEIPHMYLNYKKNQHSINIGERVSLPVEFEKNFTLSIPRGYHLEALQIFTPDTIHEILKLPITSDIEFVGGEILFFFEGIHRIVSDFDKLEEQVSLAKKLMEILRPSLERLRWSPVGDKVYHL